jgi:hypothetical protein
MLNRCDSGGSTVLEMWFVTVAIASTDTAEGSGKGVSYTYGDKVPSIGDCWHQIKGRSHRIYGRRGLGSVMHIR